MEDGTCFFGVFLLVRSLFFFYLLPASYPHYDEADSEGTWKGGWGAIGVGRRKNGRH